MFKLTNRAYLIVTGIFIQDSKLHFDYYNVTIDQPIMRRDIIPIQMMIHKITASVDLN